MSETNNETAVRSRATSTTSPSKAKLTPLVPGKEDPNRPLVELTHVEKHFGALHVLKDINLTVAKGEVLVVVGPSGSGKSTMCRTINRLETIDSGDIRIDGKPLPQEGKELANLRAEVGMVFQSFNLFANKTILENVTLALIKVRHMDKKEAEQLAMDLLARVGVDSQASKMPSQLSGGMRQRCALIRTLAAQPKVLLLDEPLGALDLKLRKEMQQELKKIQQEVGITFIYVTHDQEEALTMSDKIVVMREGEIQQIGSPTDIYNEPVNEFVANFIGESNIIEGMMVDDYKVVFGGRRFDCVDNGFGKNEVVDVVIRPEDLDIVPRGEGKLKGVVKSVLFKGVHYETMVETKVGTEITVKMAVSNDSPVYNEAANEKMSANDFYLDMEDVEELDEATIIARADAQAWNPDEDEFISIKEVDYDIKKENGKYPVTFSTAAGTSVTVNMIVKDENRVTSTENEEEIYAMNFFKKVDEIQEAVALDTDLKTWANASAWSLEDDTAVEITDVKYDFDPETITPGIYDVTFATKGYEYKIDTTDKFEVGDEVGLTFQPEDIHIMSKNNY